eukprot:TRINITY_DN113736_c0_g1_i1.p1 TRINITY_DN113736_c0_g1~~TRINITY_DN113736_c0_g1_i1.p1  ORF type:complete len:441 (+),score=4.33 TRINITY_DN113736_c0_g1_i1:67-1323(+)
MRQRQDIPRLQREGMPATEAEMQKIFQAVSAALEGAPSAISRPVNDGRSPVSRGASAQPSSSARLSQRPSKTGLFLEEFLPREESRIGESKYELYWHPQVRDPVLRRLPPEQQRWQYCGTSSGGVTSRDSLNVTSPGTSSRVWKRDVEGHCAGCPGGCFICQGMAAERRSGNEGNELGESVLGPCLPPPVAMTAADVAGQQVNVSHSPATEVATFAVRAVSALSASMYSQAIHSSCRTEVSSSNTPTSVDEYLCFGDEPVQQIRTLTAHAGPRFHDIASQRSSQKFDVLLDSSALGDGQDFSAPHASAPTWRQDCEGHGSGSGGRPVSQMRPVTKTRLPVEAWSWPSSDSVRGIPSLGSAGHATGDCRPCAYFWRSTGCNRGEFCERCHLCTQEDFREYRRGIARRRRTRKGVSSQAS